MMTRERVTQEVGEAHDRDVMLEDLLIEQGICSSGDVLDYVKWMVCVLDRQIAIKQNPSTLVSGNTLRLDDDQQRLMEKFGNKFLPVEIGYDNGGAYVASHAYAIMPRDRALAFQFDAKNRKLLELENESHSQWRRLSDGELFY